MSIKAFIVKNLLRITPGTQAGTAAGEMRVDSADSNKLKFYDGSSELTMATTADISTDVATHAAVTATHGVSGAIVGTSDSQALTNKTIDADSNTISNIDNADIKSGAAIARDKLASGTADHVLINNGSGVMSSEATLAVSRGGTNSAAALNNNRVIVSSSGAIVEASAITGNKALASDANGIPVASSVTDTELGYVSGVTSAIQTQLNAKAPSSSPTLTTPTTDIVTLDGQASTPSSPTSGYYKVYVKDADGKAYILDSSGSETKLGSGGSGGISYFEGIDLGAGTTNISTYDDTSSYADGTGGSPAAITIARNTTTPLDADGDLKISKAASDATGEGVTLLSDTIDNADLGRKLWISFEWDGTDANYVSNDMQLYAYDVTNSAILPVYAVAGVTPDSSTNTPELPNLQTKVLAYIIPPTTCTQVRVSIHCLSDSASGAAYDVYVARPKLSPEASVPGAIVTPWETAGTMTIGAVSSAPSKGTIVEDEISYRRVGNVGYFRYVYRQSVAGSAGTGDYLFSLPDGLQFDTNFITVYTGGSDVNDGSWRAYGTGGGTHDSGSHWQWAGIVPYSATQFRILISNSSSSGPFMDNANYGLNLTNYGFYVEFEVPIASWSATAALTTTEVGLQSVQAIYTSNASQSISNGATPVIVDFEDLSVDTHNSVTTGASWKFTAPKNGMYRVSAITQFANGQTWTTSSTNNFKLYLYKNGSQVIQLSTLTTFSTYTGDFFGPLSGSTEINLQKGDYIDLRVLHDETTARTLDATHVRVAITEIPDLTVFAAHSNERKNVVSKSSTYSAMPGDDVIILSGASFTLTLFSAVGEKGREVKIIHGGTSLTQVYTLATASSQTIGGVAGGSYKLCTNGEALTIVSDGSNWQILDHKAVTDWASYTPTNQGFGTETNVSMFWRRNGSDLLVLGKFTCGTNTASEARIGFPSSITSNSTVVASIRHVGKLITSWAAANDFSLLAESGTSYVVMGRNDSASSGFTKLNANTIGNSTDISVQFTVPITDWQP